MTKILYLETQNVPHTPQNNDETKGVANLINSYTPHTKAIKLPRVQRKVNLNVWGVVIWSVELTLPQKTCAPQNFHIFGAL